MTPAVFHNAILTLTTGYAEALAELDAARVAAEKKLALALQARPVSPRLLTAARAVLDAAETVSRAVDPDDLLHTELAELREAVREMGG